MTSEQERLIREADENIKTILDGASQGNSVALLLEAHAKLFDALFPDKVKQQPSLPEFDHGPAIGGCYSCRKWRVPCCNEAECYPA